MNKENIRFNGLLKVMAVKGSLYLMNILLIAGHLSAKEIVVDRPAFSVRINNTLEIEKIMLDENSTTIQIRGYDHGLKYVNSDIFLKVGGKEYPLQHYEKLDSGAYENNVKTENGIDLVPFRLFFPPIPSNTEHFDLCTCASEWMIWDVELKQPKKTGRPSTAHIPAEFKKAVNIKDDRKGLEAPQWNIAAAKLKGVIAGYKPEMDSWIEFFPVNIVTGQTDNSVSVDINPDGTFEIDVQALVTRQLRFRIRSGYNQRDAIDYDFRMRNATMFYYTIFAGQIVLSPNEESRICIDLPAHFRKEARLRYDKQSDPRIFYFAGMNAEINNQLHNPDLKLQNLRSHISNSVIDIRKNAELAKMTPSEYKERVLQAKEESITEINANPALTLKMKEFLKMELEYYAANCLDNIKTNVKMARLREYHSYTPGDTVTDPATGLTTLIIKPIDTEIEPEIAYYSYLNHLPLNNPISLYFDEYANKLRQSGSITLQNEQIPLSEITGFSDGLFFDLIKCREICGSLHYKPLQEAQIDQLKQIKEPFFEQMILARNEAVIAKIEANQSRQDYHVNQVQDKENDDLFEAIIGKEHGKVVFIDLWSDAGGPFRPLHPHIDTFDPDKMTLIYLTDETTSLDRWQYIIPDFPGEHYRLTRQQYDYMKRRLNTGLHTSLVILDNNGENVPVSDGLFFNVRTILEKINDALRF